MKKPLHHVLALAFSWMATPAAFCAEPIPLRAGPVTMSFDAESAPGTLLNTPRE